MAKQTFTTGQVLTATQMNNLQANDYNWTTSAKVASYTLVAADAGTTITMTNASATTITVNTSLFTVGDTVRVINLGAGTCTITAGTATVNTAGSLALPQYASGSLWFSSASTAIWIPDDRTTASGLTLITSSSFTNAATVTVDNCFSSTYKRYIATTQITAGVGGATQALQLQFRYGSTTQAASYYSAGNIASYTGSSGVTSISNGSVIRIQSNMGYTQQRFEFGFVGNASERAIINWQSWGGDQGESFQGGGYVSSAQTYTGFILSNSLGSANMTGTVWVYGLAAS